MKKLITLFCVLYSLPGFSSLIYMNINETITPGDSYGLDIDNDGLDEFEFYNIDQYPNYKPAVIPQTTYDDVIGSGSNGEAYDLQAGAMIQPSSNWSQSYGNYLYMWDFMGETRYLGIKFKINNSTHMGWVKIRINETGYYFEILEMAYNSVPNTVIQAGQSEVGLEEISPDAYTLQKEGNTAHFSFTGTSPEMVKVFDVSGKEISCTTVNTYNVQIHFPASGLYIITFQFADNRNYFLKLVI